MKGYELTGLTTSVNKAGQIAKEDLLGMFFKGYIGKRGVSLERLASYCLVPDTYIEKLLNGDIPEVLIEDDLLVDIANVLDTHPDVFRIILGRCTSVEVYNDIIKQAEDIVDAAYISSEKVISVPENQSDDNTDELEREREEKDNVSDKQRDFVQDVDSNETNTAISFQREEGQTPKSSEKPASNAQKSDDNSARRRKCIFDNAIC